MKSYKITDTVEFNVYPYTTGVCVSGGADSALLLYFTLMYSTNTVHVFSLANQERWLRNTHAALNVISKCAELTGNYNFVHHIHYDQVQTKENLFLLPNQYVNDNIISTICTGVTKNPPIEVTDTFTLIDSEVFERDPSVLRNVKQGNCYMPWTNLDKQDLCSIYKQHNLLDTLFPVTRSCEWHDLPWPDAGDGHCGKCWWCEERMWGFGKL